MAGGGHAPLYGVRDPGRTNNIADAYSVLIWCKAFLARTVNGHNPGAGHVRIALVAAAEECAQGVEWLVAFARARQPAAA